MSNTLALLDLPLWFKAAGWGFVAGSALLLGAAIGYLASLPRRLIAGVMAFGSGVLISALSFDLMDEAFKRGGFDSTGFGFVGGAALYTISKWDITPRGGKQPETSRKQPTSG